MIGNVYGNLLVLEEEKDRRATKIYYKCQCTKCNSIFSAEGAHIRKKEVRCPKCIRKNFHDITGQKFGLLTAIEPTDKRYQKSIVWKCKCDCGNFKEVSAHSLLTHGTQSCGCLTFSIGERNVEACLKKHQIPYIKQFCFEQDKRKKYDFAIINDKKEVIRLVEFDGKQHFGKDGDLWFKSDSYEIRMKRDHIKNQYAKEQNIPLVRIPYWERDKITIDMIIGDKYEL